MKFQVFFPIILFFVFAVICGGSTYASSDKGDQVKVYHVPAKKMLEYIDRKKGQKRIVLIYTSWCPYCREKMPDIMDLERARKGSVIAISVDEDYAQYAKYAKTLKNSPFPLFLNDGAEQSLKNALKKSHSIKPWSGYPTLIFLDENNQAVSQGNYTVEQAAKYLFGQ
ncbi:MAG: TlpA family protein disulfide reductase [Alphaproteobacteria bacterium]